MKINRSFSTSVAIAACMTGSAYAQTGDRDTTRHLAGDHMINEVVVTGQYAPSGIEHAVQKINIIDRKKIDAMSAQNLRDALSNEMNIRLSEDNILGSSVSMLGITGENVKILIDDVPVIGRQNGNIDLSQINLANIDRIEIIEGPMSVSYGTDALAGTINLITRKTQNKTLEAGATTYYESIGNYNANAHIGVSEGKSTVTLSGGRNFFDGWTNGEKPGIDFAPRIADSSRAQSWHPKEQYFGDAAYTYKTEKTSISYKVSYFGEEIMNRGLPTAPYGEAAFDDYYRTRRIDNALLANTGLKNQGNINVMTAYNDYKQSKNTYYTDLTNLSQKPTTNDGDQDTGKFHNFESRGTYSTGKSDARINYEVGYDIDISEATGARIKNDKQSMGDYAAFASAEYKPIDALTMRPGIRYAYNTDYKAPLIPSLNLRYKLTDNLVLRGSYAKGFRSPGLKELYFDFVDVNHNIHGNENLKAEHSDNFSLSAIYAKRLTSFTYKIDGALFYNNIRDRIELEQLINSTEYSYINVGKYITQGAQVNGEIAVKQLKVSAGTSLTGAYSWWSPTRQSAGFTYSPEVRVNVFYELKKYGLTTALFYKYTGNTPSYVTDGTTVTLAKTSDYSIADLTLAKSLFEKRLVISIGSKNLFDVKNIRSTAGAGSPHSVSANNIPLSRGRSYFIKADLNLKKK